MIKKNAVSKVGIKSNNNPFGSTNPNAGKYPSMDASAAIWAFKNTPIWRFLDDGTRKGINVAAHADILYGVLKHQSAPRLKKHLLFDEDGTVYMTGLLSFGSEFFKRNTIPLLFKDKGGNWRFFRFGLFAMLDQLAAQDDLPDATTAGECLAYLAPDSEKILEIVADTLDAAAKK
jgi:hypothetical protein